MKKKIIYNLLIIALLIILGYESYNTIKTLNDNKIIENIKVIDNYANNKTFAIMVQDADTEDWHEDENRDSWPDPSEYGFVSADCTDSEGSQIDYRNILQFDLANNSAIINTKNSIYCTLYFAKGTPVMQKLQETGGSVFAEGGDHTTAVDGLYRYKGTAAEVTNNYICFGTTDENECLGDPDKYIYRIMGITDGSVKNTDIGLTANQLKIIKALPSTVKEPWNSNGGEDVKWDSTSMRKYLNETFYLTIKNQPNGDYWDSIISDHMWYCVATTYLSTEVETSEKTATNSKIALMYMQDYKLASKYGSNGSADDWLNIRAGWSTSKSMVEWTMTKGGYDRDFKKYLAFPIIDCGVGNPTWTDSTTFADVATRPVFYLQSDINLTGEGNSEHPFRITTRNNA